MTIEETVRRACGLLRTMADEGEVVFPSGHRLTLVQTADGARAAWACETGNGKPAYLGADVTLQGLLDYAAGLSEEEWVRLSASRALTSINRNGGTSPRRRERSKAASDDGGEAGGGDGF